MRISTFGAADLRPSDGFDFATVDMGQTAQLGVGASWVRVAPGDRSGANQHDETETWIVVAGKGEVVVDAGRHPVGPASVIQFEPFETHFVENTGDTDFVFTSLYWRDTTLAVRAAGATGRRRFGERPVFVFSAAPTPNGDLHLGHLSGPFLAADVFVRFQRMLGVDAWNMCGTDDFQSYVAAAARREGRTPAQTAAHYSDEIEATFRLMDFDIHQYLAVSRDESFPEAVRRFVSGLLAAPQVGLREAEGVFDADTGEYLFEADVAGHCPRCGGESGGTMCEGCREPNDSADLVDVRATTSGRRLRKGPVTRYSLALHELGPAIAEHHRLGRVPASVKELANRLFARERLDVALTHPATWGVPANESEVDGQIVWSWVDFAYRVLHGIEQLGRHLGRDWRADAPEGDWKIVHFLGSDNMFFQPIFSPALYRLVHPQWNPDIDYHVNEFLQLNGAKFSTSRRHAIWGKDILSADTVDAVRLYLALVRSEGRRTNFELAEYEAFVQETLVGTWQGWLTDLGNRVRAGYGGVVPDAGIWTPEQTAFLARLEARRAALTVSLGQDMFSLNDSVATLLGLVEDTVAFARDQAPLAAMDVWRDEARTAIALELAAAQLLATCAAPLAPRFAAALTAALGLAEPTEWPFTVALVPAGTRIDLAARTFFGEREPEPVAPEPAVDPAVLPKLSTLVRGALRLPADEQVRDRTLVALGMESLQAIALQYQILEQLGADVTVEELLGDRDVAGLAALIDRAEVGA